MNADGIAELKLIEAVEALVEISEYNTGRIDMILTRLDSGE